jgi:D-beta-D-heptose 7-phosphate kinase/D-beta-D-heptose 1-phosphate adenosyltransferase
MTLVVIAGKFDPPHEGHIAHIRAAAKLGDFLCIITHSDDIVAQNSTKGICVLTFDVRRDLLLGLLLLYKIKGTVAKSTDTDGTITKSLKLIQPDILAKGGDRTPDNMPQSEIEICKEIDCKIIYGVGGDKIQSSSKLVRKTQ